MAQTKINKTAMRVLSGIHRRLYLLSGGRLGGKQQGNAIIVLTTTGRRSGEQRQRPLLAGDHDDGWVVVGSFSGHDEHPAWYLNLRADPAASVQVGAVTHQVRAREAEGDERQALWDQMVQRFAYYAEYQKVTDRRIPVVVLERQDP